MDARNSLKSALKNLTNTQNLSAKMDTDMETGPADKRKSADEVKINVSELKNKPKENISNNENEVKNEKGTSTEVVEEKVQSKISLITSTKEKKPVKQNTTPALPHEMETLLSSLYLDVHKRLCLNYQLRCARDLEFCRSNHYKTPKPEAPYYTQASNLRCSWEQARYVEYIHIIADMCIRREFPGEGVFIKLIELILSTNYERTGNVGPKQAYMNIIKVFRAIINTFPPCWIAMRPHYLRLFRLGLDINKLGLKDKILTTRSTKVVDIIFDLMEYTFKNYTKVISDKVTAKNQEINCSQNSSIFESPVIKSQCFSQWDWDDCQGDMDFSELKTDSRLERINIVLGLLVQILETDLAMWMLHFHLSTNDLIFSMDDSPLVVPIFDLTEQTRSSTLVRRLFELFSKAVSMELSQTHLKLLERFIALIMVASHTADLKNSVIGIRYPTLQEKTRELIRIFFRIFKEHNTKCLKSYITCIDLLRIPYVKYEFIENFLHIFDFSPLSEKMSVAKISNKITRTNLLKFSIANDCINLDEELSREQYLELLLKAMRAYSEMYGLEKLFLYITKQIKIEPMTTITDSVHRCPNRGRPADVFCLEEMAKDKQTWYNNLRMEVRMSRPKIIVPNAYICIDKDLLATYRSDLKNCSLLQNKLAEMQIKRNERSDTEFELESHFREWHRFLAIFKIENSSQ